MSDFLAFYDSAKLLLQGRYVSLYPIPVVYMFVPFTFINPVIGWIILGIISLVCLVIIFKRKALFWIFFVPIIQTIWQGQLDIIFFCLYKWDHVIGYVLLTLKPQLFILALPELIKKSGNWWLTFCTGCAILYAPFIIIRPTWIIEWLHQFSGDGRANTSASFYVAGLLVMIVIPMLGGNYKGTILSGLPIYRPYDYTFLAGMNKIIIPVSWILFYLVNIYQVDWIWAFLAIASINFNQIMNYASIAERQRQMA